MMIAEIDMNPLDHGKNAKEEVAKLVEIIAESGLNFEVGPMGTSIEGELEEVMAVVQQCMMELSRDSNKFVFSIRGDFERGREQSLEKRVEEVVEGVFGDEGVEIEATDSIDDEIEMPHEIPQSRTLQ